MTAIWLESEYLWSVERKCKHCRKSYRERDNTAAWRCTFHPGKIVTEYFKNHPIGTWSCCGKATRDGCTAIDHDDGFYLEDKNQFFMRGIDPLKLSSEAQERLWKVDEGRNPIYYRPGMRQVKDGDNKYKLSCHNEYVGKVRTRYGFLKELTFGIKRPGQRTPTILTIQIAVRDGKTVKLLYDRANVDYGNGPLEKLMTVVEGRYKYIKKSDGSLFEDQFGSIWSYLDTNQRGGVEVSGRSFEDLIRYILRHRDRLGDPHIAYFTCDVC
mgnify:CR=1 FL=1|jgi:hypothetical protein|tara:strand:+ start:322 stop:1128 length:807 start_codon:yes stop_codon:yes gene_type:complete